MTAGKKNEASPISSKQTMTVPICVTGSDMTGCSWEPKASPSFLVCPPCSLEKIQSTLIGQSQRKLANKDLVWVRPTQSYEHTWEENIDCFSVVFWLFFNKNWHTEILKMLDRVLWIFAWATTYLISKSELLFFLVLVPLLLLFINLFILKQGLTL